MAIANPQFVAELTVEQLRRLLEPLPADTPVRLGIRDEHHFNRFLGDLPIAGASVQPAAAGQVVIFECRGLPPGRSQRRSTATTAIGASTASRRARAAHRPG